MSATKISDKEKIAKTRKNFQGKQVVTKKGIIGIVEKIDDTGKISIKVSGGKVIFIKSFLDIVLWSTLSDKNKLDYILKSLVDVNMSDKARRKAKRDQANLVLPLLNKVEVSLKSKKFGDLKEPEKIALNDTIPFIRSFIRYTKGEPVNKVKRDRIDSVIEFFRFKKIFRVGDEGSLKKPREPVKKGIIMSLDLFGLRMELTTGEIIRVNKSDAIKYLSIKRERLEQRVMSCDHKNCETRETVLPGMKTT